MGRSIRPNPQRSETSRANYPPDPQHCQPQRASLLATATLRATVVMMQGWFVYVLVSLTSKRTYVGVTKDLQRRLQQHNGSRPGGAKSTRAGRPWRIGCTHGPFETQGEALRAELRLKRVRGLQRLRVTAEMLAE